MTSNAEAADRFREIADLLDLLGERFKPEAYRRAARSIESLTESLAAVAGRDELRQVPGVGEAIEEKIREYLATGSIPYLEKLRAQVPPGLVEIMRLPGLGPKTARRFWLELGVEGPAELRAAIAQGRLTGVKGFGEKKVEQIRHALEGAAAASAARRPIESVYPVARRLLDALARAPGADQVAIAGSFRRGRETVGDLDLLVTSRTPEAVFDAFSRLPEIGEVRMRGPTKETVVLANGLQADLRVVEPEAFGAALVYFTGSKDHNVELRTLARDRGLKVNEYGVFRAEERLASRTEADVYAALDLPLIPPELREARGEIDDARAGRLPVLVEDADLAVELHAHLPDGAGPAELDALAEAAGRLRVRSVGVIVGGVGADGRPFVLPPAVLERLARTPPGSPAWLRAIEAGPGPLPPALARMSADYRILRGPLPSGAGWDAGAPPVRLLAHAGPSIDLTAPWVAAAHRAGLAVEVGPGDRLDSTAARAALEAGLALAVPTGVGLPDGATMRAVGLGFARRAGATRVQVASAEQPVSGGRRSRRP